MKKIILILVILFTTFTNAQAPQGVNYQATIRNSSGSLLINQSVVIKFNIIQGVATNTPVYIEQHTLTTDDLGSVNLIIGQGTASQGQFNQINWGLGNFFLGIEINSGSGFVAMGTTQLLSVPYALYAEKSGSLSSGIVPYKTFKPKAMGTETEFQGFLLPTNENIIECGFVYSTTNTNPTATDATILINDESSSAIPIGYIQPWATLTNGQTYHCRVYAKNASNIYFYGNVVTFIAGQ